MPKKVVNKTRETAASVEKYIQSLSDDAQLQARQLDELFREVIDLKPKMWGSSIIGYGKYIYYRANGDEGEFMATGFAMRKSGPVIYIMPGYQRVRLLLEKLGPHKLGKSCLYLKRLSDVDVAVLKDIIKQGLQELKTRHQVLA